jgi:hypothetical protein
MKIIPEIRPAHSTRYKRIDSSLVVQCGIQTDKAITNKTKKIDI